MLGQRNTAIDNKRVRRFVHRWVRSTREAPHKAARQTDEKNWGCW